MDIGSGSGFPSATLSNFAPHPFVIDGIEYTLHFKDYTDDSPFNIVRNHYYQYTITGVNGGVELELNYQVENWTDVKNPTINFQ